MRTESRTQSRPCPGVGRQQSCQRQGKPAGHHRGLRAGHVKTRVIRELGRTSRLLGSNRRSRGDRHKQHPGVYWLTRPANEPTSARAGEGHGIQRVNPRYRKGAKSGPTGKDEGSRSNAQYRGSGRKPGPEAWGTEAQGTHDNTQRSAGRQCRAWRWWQGTAGGTLSPQTVCTKLAPSAQESGRMRMHSDGQQKPCRLVVSSTARLMAPTGPLLTNRMSELLTYGSVGGGGSNPSLYPAADAEWRVLFGSQRRWPRAAQAGRYAPKPALICRGS
jgi:hypothetical protein